MFLRLFLDLKAYFLFSIHWTKAVALSFRMRILIGFQHEAENQIQSQGCHAGSIRQRLSGLIAAPIKVVTFVSAPSNSAKSEINLNNIHVISSFVYMIILVHGFY